MKKAIVIGGGFTGCCSAFMLEKEGYDVEIYEASEKLGGGLRTEFYKGHPYTVGPHHLILDKDDKKAYDFFNGFVPLREITHYVLTLPNGENTFFNFPTLESDIEKMQKKEQIKKELKKRDFNKEPKNFEEYWQNAVGDTLYSMFVKEYSKKMWSIRNNQELDQNINLVYKEEPVRKKLVDYFDGKKRVYYPVVLNGYNDMFDKMTANCKVHLNTPITEFNIENKEIYVNGEWKKADIIVSTISPDMLLNYKYGELKYKGRDFLKILLPIERITPEPYYFLYYAGDEPYTRIVEYKLLTGYKSKDTLIGIEFPSDNNKLYPYLTKAEVDRANRYFADLPDGVFSIGRLGAYKYKDMYAIYNDCLDLMKKL